MEEVEVWECAEMCDMARENRASLVACQLCENIVGGDDAIVFFEALRKLPGTSIPIGLSVFARIPST